eukprot:55704-Amphidinium_carterae.1
MEWWLSCSRRSRSGPRPWMWHERISVLRDAAQGFSTGNHFCQFLWYIGVFLQLLSANSAGGPK